DRFLGREAQLARGVRILPIYYITCTQMRVSELIDTDPIAQEVHRRQYADWRDLRRKSWSNQKVRAQVRRLAERIADLLKPDTIVQEAHLVNADSNLPGLSLNRTAKNMQEKDLVIRAEPLKIKVPAALPKTEVRAVPKQSTSSGVAEYKPPYDAVA